MVCAYDPVGYGLPYNHLLFSDFRGQLVEQALQILIVTLEQDGGPAGGAALRALTAAEDEQDVRRTTRMSPVLDDVIVMRVFKRPFPECWTCKPFCELSVPDPQGRGEEQATIWCRAAQRDANVSSLLLRT